VIIAIAIFGDNEVSRLLAPIAENYPAFAAEIVNEGLASWFGDVALPRWDRCGRQVRTAMQAWVTGIGSLAQLIAPVREDGTVPPIGAHTDGIRLTTGWYYGNEDLNDVKKLPASELPEFLGVGTYRAVTSLPDWTGFRSAPTVSHAAWAWRWTLDELVAPEQVLPHSLNYCNTVRYLSVMVFLSMKLFGRQRRRCWQLSKAGHLAIALSLLTNLRNVFSDYRRMFINRLASINDFIGTTSTSL
jgi:hypothetical protein